jgi:hypothetical protein
MEKIIPLAAADVVGPLGVKHLPRLWLKCGLSAAGLLPEVYLDNYFGTNKTIIDALGLDPDATFAYLKTTPSYQEFEVWTKANATNLTPESIAASNAAVDAQQKPGDKAAAVRAQVGLADPTIGGSTILNALDDWDTVHRDLVARRGTPIQPIVPALSSQSAGPLGLKHLPRFWLKATLEATGALYDQWKSGLPSGFDTWFGGAVGLDVPRAVAFIHAELPTYMVFEAWFTANAAHISPAEIEAHNAAMAVRVKPDHIAAEERAVLGIDDPSYKLSREMNDLVDWHTLHGLILTAQRPVGYT